MKRPDTITVLLAVIAVLLGLNLLHAPAEAQPQVQVPVRVTGLAMFNGTLTRVWSDGAVEWRQLSTFNPPTWVEGLEWAEVTEP